MNVLFNQYPRHNVQEICYGLQSADGPFISIVASCCTFGYEKLDHYKSSRRASAHEGGALFHRLLVRDEHPLR